MGRVDLVDRAKLLTATVSDREALLLVAAAGLPDIGCARPPTPWFGASRRVSVFRGTPPRR
jgi:hypothetical protein